MSNKQNDIINEMIEESKDTGGDQGGNKCCPMNNCGNPIADDESVCGDRH